MPSWAIIQLLVSCLVLSSPIITWLLTAYIGHRFKGKNLQINNNGEDEC